MPMFKDEHILLIAPGSQTTLAQLGLPESFTPPQFHIPSRMYPSTATGKWTHENLQRETDETDAQPQETGGSTSSAGDPQHDAKVSESKRLDVKDPKSPSATYPMEKGRIVDWPCFFALLSHVYNTLSPPFHTPILILAQACWTAHDYEAITQFCFEMFKTPALCILDAALAVSYGWATSTCAIIDVGWEKCDITPIIDHIVDSSARITAMPDCGGQAMTSRLLDLLHSSQGFDLHMCDALKHDTICEILLPGSEYPSEDAANDLARPPGEEHKGFARHLQNADTSSAAPKNNGPEDPGQALPDADDEGILDVASIVASGKTSEFLAKKEKEKAEKAANKKILADAAAAEKKARLPNSQKVRALFTYEPPSSPREPTRSDTSKMGLEPSSTEHDSQPAETAAADKESPEKQQNSLDNVIHASKGSKRQTEVGIERFQAATGGILDRIADAFYRSVMSVMDASKRSQLWESIIVIGNGSKVKGFQEALLATLETRYLIARNSLETSSQSSLAQQTASRNPDIAKAQQKEEQMSSSTTNPLRQAPNLPTQHANDALRPVEFQSMQGQSSIATNLTTSQTPTIIKTLKPPEYFPEWKDSGMEEVSFLGAQVAARVVFVVDQGMSKGFMTRSEYNELGPSGIHECCF